MRTFISLNPDNNALKDIFEIQQQVKNRIAGINEEFLNSIKWETEDKFHLTLFFTGETEETNLNIIHSKLEETKNELKFGHLFFKTTGINAFPKLKFPRVIIIELENLNRNVFMLSEKINAKLKEIGFNTDKKFHPHITLGRVKRDRKINLSGLEKIVIPELNFEIKEFNLMKSELKNSGSQYTVLNKYDLK